MSLFRQRCRFCGRTAGQLILLALAQEAGAQVYPPVSERCEAREDEGEHEFEAPEGRS